MQRTFELEPRFQRYLNQAMQSVSRSFALVVPNLEKPLSDFMATSYLLCRVVDNVEDSGQPLAWQKPRFAEFTDLLHNPAQAPEILARWEQEEWPSLTPHEAKLMGRADGETLWQIYAQLPEQTRQSITRWISTMARGMEGVEDPAQAPNTIQTRGVRLLCSAGDYDQYCYYVAGTVGRLGTELVVDHYQLDSDVAEQLGIYSEACGRALQKTNIVKDFAEDLRRGVSFLPDEWMQAVDYQPLSLAGAPTEWTYDVLADVLAELQDSVSYVLALPTHVVGYRIASLLCLMPAYQTILLAAQKQKQLFTAEHQVKISRPAMAKCLVDAPRMVSDNEGIIAYSQKMDQAVRAVFGHAQPAPEFAAHHRTQV